MRCCVRSAKQAAHAADALSEALDICQGARAGERAGTRFALTSCILTQQSALQISGGNKYLPPRQDVNAPDLYIPLCALMTYVVLAGMVATANRRFSPSSLYSLVRVLISKRTSICASES